MVARPTEDEAVQACLALAALGALARRCDDGLRVATALAPVKAK